MEMHQQLRERNPEKLDEDHTPLVDRKVRGKAFRHPSTNNSWLDRILREARIRWSVLSMYSKIILTILILTLSSHVALGTLDLVGKTYRRDPFLNKENGFAVVINTYKRPNMLKEAVQHYASTCGKRYAVKQVFVVWAELSVTPPSLESFFPANIRNDPANRAAVEIIRVKKDSLNSRFEPISNLKYQSIFMVDDDVRVKCRDLRHGFDAWRAHPEAMVGYYPRLAAKPKRSKATTKDYIYQAWPVVFLKGRMNFVLTKAAFIHQKYLQLYTYQQPQEIKDYVDKYFNCEDVAMSMLVANHTHAAPIYVEGHIRDRGLFNGISTGTGHMARRSQCLTDLTEIYRQHGWTAPLGKQSYRLQDVGWVQHVPGLWWQHQPSNIFEWLALENVFQ